MWAGHCDAGSAFVPYTRAFRLLRGRFSEPYEILSRFADQVRIAVTDYEDGPPSPPSAGTWQRPGISYKGKATAFLGPLTPVQVNTKCMHDRDSPSVTVRFRISREAVPRSWN